jgi:hypothetical protein
VGDPVEEVGTLLSGVHRTERQAHHPAVAAGHPGAEGGSWSGIRDGVRALTGR